VSVKGGFKALRFRKKQSKYQFGETVLSIVP
jgi:hypothetical protein